MKMVSTLAVAALSASAALFTIEADGVTLKVDQVKQRYPWNGLVDIDYTVTNDNGTELGIDDNLEVLMVDKSVVPVVTNRAVTFLQAPLPLSAGAHRITWNANADGVTSRSDSAEFRIKLVHYSAQYMVIDVSGGANATTYPVDFLNGAPSGGFNHPVYKSDKIVLRRIHPGSFVAGSPSNEASHNSTREKQHNVAFTKPFYIGIFEITQEQYSKVMDGQPPSTLTGAYHPVENVSYDMIRGGSWPAEAAPANNSFMDKLLKKCRASDDAGNYSVEITGFDLPTEFQWEYACRAGTAYAFNTTNSFDNTSQASQIEQLEQLGCYKSNPAPTSHAVVGSYLPNSWGLYDMHGNVWEWCRDLYQDDVVSLKQYVDPEGPNTGTARARRGGCWNAAANYCRSGHRDNTGSSSRTQYIGFRLSLTMP